MPVVGMRVCGCVWVLAVAGGGGVGGAKPHPPYASTERSEHLLSFVDRADEKSRDAGRIPALDAGHRLRTSPHTLLRQLAQ